jgi:hypothetical protein
MEGIDYCSMVMILGMDMVQMLSISMEGIDYCSNGYDSGYGYGTCYQSQWRGLITAQMVMSLVMVMDNGHGYGRW